MNFFFDRCVPIALARMVAALETKLHHVVHHDNDERFHSKTTDVEWMQAIGGDQPKPIVISGDGKILKRPDEVNTLREQRLTFFLLGEDFEEMPARVQAWKFLKSWESIVDICEKKIREPSIYRVRAGTSQKVEFERHTKELPRK